LCYIVGGRKGEGEGREGWEGEEREVGRWRSTRLEGKRAEFGEVDSSRLFLLSFPFFIFPRSVSGFAIRSFLSFECKCENQKVRNERVHIKRLIHKRNKGSTTSIPEKS